MNLTALKQIIKANGDKCILVENDEPEYVLMSFREYQRLAGSESRPLTVAPDAITVNDMLERSSRGVRLSDADSLPERVPLEPRLSVAEPRSQAEYESRARHDYPLRLEDIRLEDLPI